MRALIVDPSRSYRQLIRKILENENFVVHEAESRQQTLEILRENGAMDLVCLSITLPDCSGFTLCRELHEHADSSSRPILIFTASLTQNFRTSAEIAGAVDILEKDNLNGLYSHIQLLKQKRNELGSILYVEDSPSQAEFISLFLNDRLYRVTHCDTAEAAIEKFKKESFDLVLTDIVLAGGMSGLELIKHIREHESIFIRTPILAMSSQTGSEQVVELLSAGANDYVHKPVLLEELSVRISHLVQHRQLLEKLHTQSQRLERLAMHDQLTGLYNRHFLMEIAPQHISYAQRNSAPLSILVIDIDKFKSINDTHGHLMGDQVLSAISNLLTEACRREDILVRYGGEEFVALMHCDLESCAQKAEFLRKKIAELKPNNIVVTASFGVTSLHTEETDFYSFFQRSDHAVYQAKHNGRNCIEINP